MIDSIAVGILFYGVIVFLFGVIVFLCFDVPVIL